MLGLAKDQIKFLYKKLIVWIFFKIYKKPKYKKNLKLKNFYLSRIKIKKKIYSIYQLNNGRVYTNKNDITAYINNENYLANGSMQFKKFDKINSKNQPLHKNFTLTNGTPNFKKKINGNVLSLLSGGAARDNFTHWFTDVIPRVILFKKRYNLSVIDKFYLPSTKYKFQIESLDLINIPRKKFLSSEKIKHIEAKKLFYTSHPCHFFPSKAEKWSFESLRSLYIPKKLKKDKKFKLIFIDRDQLKLLDKKNLKRYSSWRVLLNEYEIKNFLITKGFQIVKPENFSLKKQIKIFNNAEVIISLYGAAMMMIAFCNKNAKIIEIKPEKSGNDFKNISNHLNLKHEQIIIKPKYKSSTPQNGLLFCDLDLIKKKFKKLKINFRK